MSRKTLMDVFGMTGVLIRAHAIGVAENDLEDSKSLERFVFLTETSLFV